VLIVATAVFDDDHAFDVAGALEAVNCDVAPIQTDNVPDSTGNALIVTVAEAEHPLLLVYVIIVVPADTLVTKPVLFTVATAVFDDVHGDTAAGKPEPVNCVVAP
jgi:hypothetical protein